MEIEVENINDGIREDAEDGVAGGLDITQEDAHIGVDPPSDFPLSTGVSAPTVVVVPSNIVKPPIPGKAPSKRSVPNYASDEVVAAVWAYIAMSEEEANQAMPTQLRRIARHYPLKARELFRLGKWRCARAPDQSGELRCANPSALMARAKKAMEIVMNQITPVWHKVKSEHHSGWGTSEFIMETKKRYIDADVFTIVT